MEELYSITPVKEGKIKVSIHAMQNPRNIKSLLDSCAFDSVDSIVFEFNPDVSVDYLLLQAMLLLHKNNKKISIDGEFKHSEVVTQIWQKIVSKP